MHQRHFLLTSLAGARVMMYFCTRPVPHGIDPLELKKLHDFSAETRSRGLIQEFQTSV